METSQCFTLQTNYRCSPNICEAAQKLINHNRIRVGKRTEASRAKKKDDWPVVAWIDNADSYSEWNLIAKELLHGAKTKRECAVLCRTNDIAFECAQCLQAWVPVRKRERTEKPHDWPMVQSFLSFAMNPENDFAAYWFVRISKGDWFADKVRLEAAQAGQSINGYCMRVPNTATYDDIWTGLCSIGTSAESLQLVKKAQEALLPGEGVAALAIALGNEELHYREEGQGVTVTTYHASKGREFDWVIVAGCDDEVIPGKVTGPDLEENRRLLFVAMTRARERLIFTSAKSRKVGHWQKWPQDTTPSRFLSELGLVH
jgi:superfamily I DNA/RNA helicase